MNSPKQIWQAVLGNLELSLSKANFTTWFKNTTILDHRNDKIIVGVPNTFTKEWLTNKYHQDILRALKTINPEIKTIEYRISSLFAPKTEPQKTEQAQQHQTVSAPAPQAYSKSYALSSGLNPKYGFDSFI